jgi:hypothetical protein
MVSEHSVHLFWLFTEVYDSQEMEHSEFSTMILTSCTSRSIDMMVDVSIHAPTLALSIWLGMARRQERKFNKKPSFAFAYQCLNGRDL